MWRASAAWAMSMVRFITSKLPSLGTDLVPSTSSTTSSSSRLGTVAPSRVEHAAGGVVSSSDEVLRHILFNHSVGRPRLGLGRLVTAAGLAVR